MDNNEARIQKLELGPEASAFAQGGNRLCFIHPTDPTKCVKTLRRDRMPELKQKEKGLKGRLKKRSAFDDNQQEYSTFLRIADLYGSQALQFIPRCYGMVATNHGAGLVTDLVRDFDGAISMTLKQYVWIHGNSPRVKNCIAAFQQGWASIGLPSRNLLLHNIVVQLSAPEVIRRLVVIDGLGWADILPFAWWSRTLARTKAERKAERLNEAIETLLEIRRTNGEWGYHGWMEPAQRYVGLVETQVSVP